MNADRRQTAQVCVALLMECHEIGLISDASHLAVTDALKSLQAAEFWQLRQQEKHEGKNDSTDKQIAVCRIALPALDAAVKAWNDDDFEEVIIQLRLAATTDGTAPRKQRQQRARKAMANTRRKK